MRSRVALRTPATTFFPGQGSATLPAPTQKAGLTGRIGLKRNGFQSAGRWRHMAEVPGSNCRVADRRNKHSGRAVQHSNGRSIHRCYTNVWHRTGSVAVDRTASVESCAVAARARRLYPVGCLTRTRGVAMRASVLSRGSLATHRMVRRQLAQAVARKLQRVIETRAKVLQRDRSSQFDQLRIIKVML